MNTPTTNVIMDVSEKNMHISTENFSMDVYTKKNNMIISTKNVSMDRMYLPKEI